MPRSRPSVAPSPVIEPVAPDSPFANVPRRATGNLTLGFGTTAIPCNVYAGTEDNGIKRSEWIEAGEDADDKYLKVGRAYVVAGTDVPVDKAAVLRLVEASDGTLVPLSDDEVAAAIGCEGGFCEVEQFLPLSVMNAGTYIVDSLYQLRPAPARSGGTNRRSETTGKAFALLIKAMRLEGVFALCRVALRGKPRYAAFMPDGRLYTLRYTNEVRLPLPLPLCESNDDEMMLARMIVAARTSNVPPMLRDTSTEQVRAFVDSKAEGIAHTSVDRPAPDRSYEAMIGNLREQVRGMALGPAAEPQPVMPEAIVHSAVTFADLAESARRHAEVAVDPTPRITTPRVMPRATVSADLF